MGTLASHSLQRWLVSAAPGDGGVRLRPNGFQRRRHARSFCRYGRSCSLAPLRGSPIERIPSRSLCPSFPSRFALLRRSVDRGGRRRPIGTLSGRLSPGSHRRVEHRPSWAQRPSRPPPSPSSAPPRACHLLGGHISTYAWKSAYPTPSPIKNVKATIAMTTTVKRVAFMGDRTMPAVFSAALSEGGLAGAG
jgi:hypothetical protein